MAAGEAAPTGLPRPVLGLVGQLSERIDLDILTALSDAGFALLLVGPRDPRWEAERFAELAGRPAVHYTGRVPAASVPAYLAAIDVGITPYTASDFNRASFPLKTLEYLAAGRPVVSTDLPGARWLLEDLARAGLAVAGEGPAEIMTLASTPAEFVSAVRRMVPGPARSGKTRPGASSAGLSPPGIPGPAGRMRWPRPSGSRRPRRNRGRGDTYSNRASRPDSRTNYLARRISGRFLSKFGHAITWVGRPGAAGGTARQGMGVMHT